MKRVILTTIVVLVSGSLGYLAAVFTLSRSSDTTLGAYNAMASDNFKTALLLFRDGHTKKSFVIFGEGSESSEFAIGDYRFKVYPQELTTSEDSEDSVIGNTAAHMNGMIIMLACRWIKDGNPYGDKLLNELQTFIPNFESSSPGIPLTKTKDLRSKPELIDSEADQWDWRMKP